MLRPGDIRPGDPSTRLTARDYEDIVAAVRRSLTAGVSPPLTRKGRTIGLERRDPLWVTLSGSSSPYDFVEAVEGSTAGAWDDRAIEGTANAYEVNEVADLDGKRALIYPGAPGDYRFQWITDGDGGGDPPPITCLCWHDDDRPSSLSYTADFYHIDSGTLLGSRSGTLTYMDPVTFAKTGGGTCTLAPPSGVAGWIGDWSDYCFILNPDDTVTGVERPHCMEDTAPSTCANTGGTRCRYLWVACSAIGVGGVSPFGRVGVAETYYNAISSSYVCLAPNVVFSGSTLSCSPFSLTYLGGSGRFGVQVDLTITL